MTDLKQQLKISENRLTEINDLLTDPNNETIGRIIEIVEKYGGPAEINRKAAEAKKFENLMARLKEINSPYVADLDWLAEQRDKKAFVSMADYYDRVLGDRRRRIQDQPRKCGDPGDQRAAVFSVADCRSQAGDSKKGIDARPLYPGPQHAGASPGQRRHSGHGRRSSNCRRHLCRNPGHQRHRRFQHSSWRSGYHYRLFRRHRSAE